MPKFIGTVAEIKFDTRKFLDALDKEANAILVEGIRAWLDTIVSIVPNWSGMSLASLQELGDKVGITVNAFPVSGAPNRVAEGRSLGPTTIKRGPNIYSFEWRTKVLQFIINEQFDARQWGFRLRHPGPYNAIPQAQAAFLKTVDARLAVIKLPFKVLVRQRKI